MNPQEKAIQAIRKLKEKRFLIVADIAKKQRVITEIDAILLNFKNVVESKLRLKGAMSGGVKLEELIVQISDKVEEYIKAIDDMESSTKEDDLALSTTFVDSAADDVNIAIENLGKEIDNMSGGKKRKMKKTKTINKKSKKTKKTKKNNKKSRKH